MNFSGPNAGSLRAIAVLALLVVGGSNAAWGQNEQAKPTPEEVDKQRQENLLTLDERTEPTLRGYCPVAYFHELEPVKGDPKYKSRYADHVYHLTSVKAKQAFDQDPGKYLPEFDGLCTMALGGPYGNRFLGHPEVFEMRMGRLYLFSSERAKRLYLKTPEAVLDKARERFGQPLVNGYCPVSYQTEKKAVTGDPKFTAAWQGYTYRLASAEAKKIFLKDPARYAPQYHGYCATSILGNIRREGKPELFRVVKDRTYIFNNKAALKQFEANTAETIKAADAKWAKLKKLR